MPRVQSLVIELKNAKATRSWGKKLASTLKPGDTVALIGDLGTGKTTLVQGIASGWGYEGDITSPTFSLVNEYPTRHGPIYHMDMYRLTRQECAVFPLEDYFYQQALCLVEWADRVHSRWPKDTVEIRMTNAGDDIREIRIKRKIRG